MAETVQLSPTDPFRRRFWAWMRERFPPLRTVLFLVIYAAALLFGRAAAHPGPVVLAPLDLLGFVGAWCFFFTLRVVDEHKDYEQDLQDHPERVLQRGLVTLGQLRAAGIVAVAAQLAAVLALDGRPGPIGAAWAGAMLWMTLLAREFFCGRWLARHPLLSPALHLVVMPLGVLWMAQIGAGERWLPWSALWYGLLAYLFGASFELGRKTLGPEEEREGVPSYSALLGPRGAALLLVLLLLGAGTALWLVLRALLGTPAWGWDLGVGGATLLLLAAPLRFAARPSAGRRKLDQVAVSAAMLLAYLAVMAAVLLLRGVSLVPD